MLARSKQIRQVLANANGQWVHLARCALVEVCRTREIFTTADILERVNEWGQSTHDLRALGAVLTEAEDCGYCHPVAQWVGSLRLWKSCLFH